MLSEDTFLRWSQRAQFAALLPALNVLLKGVLL